MKRLLILGFVVFGCGQDIGRKKDKEPLTPIPISVDPITDPTPTPTPSATPTVEPSPTPTPTPTPTTEPKPTPTPNPKPSEVFLEQSWGRWIGRCFPKDDGKTSWMGGIEIFKDKFVYLSFWYPNVNNCSGPASPNDGDPKVYELEFIREKDGGWFQLKGNCKSGKCSGQKYIMARLDKYLYVKETKDESTTDGTETIYPNGPGR
jgi:hypothetical protein